jgi:hypothetical protein
MEKNNENYLNVTDWIIAIAAILEVVLKILDRLEII